MDLNVALMRELRAAVGDDVEIGFDAYQGWDLQLRARVVPQGRAVPALVPRGSLPHRRTSRASSGCRQSTGVPVATGEHFYNRWEVEQFLKADALHYVQADPEWCGGVSEVDEDLHTSLRCTA